MNIRISKNFIITKKSTPYIIAEIGSNHNGDMKLCEKIIKAAKKSGAHCVKFQFFSPTSIFSKKVYKDNYFIADDYRNRKDTNLFKIVEKYSVNKEQLIRIKKYCEKIKIDFLVTPFSHKEADILDKEIKVSAFKIASMDLNNYDFIKHIAKKNKPIILSTGLSSSLEIKKAVKTIENTGNKKLILLHCVAIYPPKNDEINLRRIRTLKKIYPYPVGFSDHSKGYEAALGSVAMGSCLIEKHFTIDKNMEGWDHHMSADENDLKKIAEGSKKIFQSLGSEKIYRVENKKRVVSFRRSIVAARNIMVGEKFKRDMFEFKRPANGLEPEKINKVIGRLAKRNIQVDDLISFEDF